MDKHLGSVDDTNAHHMTHSQSRTMLSSEHILENIFPEEAPERPVQHFSGRTNEDPLSSATLSVTADHLNSATNNNELNYNLMSLTQGVDQTIQLLSNQGPLSSRTVAENQFVLEASFCAVSDTILQTMEGGLSQWLSFSF